MKRSLISSIIFSILIITACSAPRQPEVTVILEVTVTLPSPTETPTPLPTPSPESLLPQEVKEKFELAGVDLKNMENAKYDKDGLHITLPSGEVIVLTNTDLQKGIYNGQDNVLQYRDETNQNVIYAYDKESGKWGAKVEQIDISNPENFRTEGWEYLISPAYLAELEQKEKDGLLPSVPEDPAYVKPGFMKLEFEGNPSPTLRNYGQDHIFSLSNEVVYLDVSKRPSVLVDISKTNILGVDMIFFVEKWDNSDGTHGFVSHFFPTQALSIGANLEKLTGREDTQYITGGFFVKNDNLDGCKKYLDQWAGPGKDYSQFCNFYYDNPEIFLPDNVYQNWKNTGILNTSKALPISPAFTNKITQ